MGNPESGFRFEALEDSRNPNKLRAKVNMSVPRRMLALAIAAAAFMPVPETEPLVKIPDEIRSGPDPLKSLNQNPPEPIK